MSLAGRLGRSLKITRQPCFVPRQQLTCRCSIRHPGFTKNSTLLCHQASKAISTSALAKAQEAYDGMPKILVFGGNGFIGSKVCEQALTTGLQVVSINRSGRPRQTAPWVDEVQWFKADVFDVPQWRSQLEGTIGVISCLGAFGSNDFMYKICGESNATIFREASKAGVARASFVSVADLKVPDAVLRGYFQGKRYAEKVLQETFPESGVALRPNFVFGTRNVGGIGIPLQAVGWPLQKALSFVPNTKGLAKYPGLSLGFIPPSSNEAVAKAAVAAATDPAVAAGTLDAWEINKYVE